ncbi:winged helix-turn-helix domain-containing protein [Trinickia sp. NRRL B-1857]|uniref:winged helix-turn-helix domain-containing protein n=1 Tax=Trinickia sp. NRRL B-1857 TaxID=3162879 RepID=UPI003D27B23F
MHTFDRIAVSFESREVFVDGELQRISMRALDILELLIEADGGLVTKDQIMRAVWPTTFVVDNNIQVHISALRKLLGGKDGWIKTDPGRGYRLARPRPESVSDTTAPSALASYRTKPLTNAMLVGRDRAVEEILEMVEADPIVTIVGAGGIGKTSVAREVARQYATGLGAQVCVVDLSTEARGATVAQAIAETLGLHRRQDESGLASRLNELSGRYAVLVLDGCDHVIAEAAAVCEALCAEQANVRLIVTAREPLRIAGERVYRLQPLSLPGPEAGEDEILASPAVQLFLRQCGNLGAIACADHASLLCLSSLCRQLDGLPLAIELAAQWAAAIGVDDLLAALDTLILALSNRLRSVPARHETLRASIDWSYGLLTEFERVVLRRLAIMDGAFDLKSACEVISCEEFDATMILGGIVNLVSKSLVVADKGDGASRYYRLTKVTRTFAKEKLDATDEFAWLRHRLEACSFDDRGTHEASMDRPASGVRHPFQYRRQSRMRIARRQIVRRADLSVV